MLVGRKTRRSFEGRARDQREEERKKEKKTDFDIANNEVFFILVYILNVASTDILFLHRYNRACARACLKFDRSSARAYAIFARTRVSIAVGM